MIIGFAGEKQSGKNTGADFISAKYEKKLRIVELSFAKKLKESAAACFGIRKDDAIDWSDWLKEHGTIEIADWYAPDGSIKVSGREFLQNYGTEAHRKIFGDDFWVNQVLPENFREIKPQITLITDCRFPNEAERIKDLGGKIIEICRPNQNSKDNHASEKPLPEDLIDLTLINNRDLPYFKTLLLSELVQLDKVFFEYYE